MSQIAKQGRNPGSNRVGTNLFGKGQRVISNAYRKGYDAIKWDKYDKENDDTFKDLFEDIKPSGSYNSGCSACGDCSACD